MNEEELSKMSEQEIRDVLSKRFEEAEKRLMNSMNEILFASGPPIKFTPEQEKAWERHKRIQKLLLPYYWLRSRIMGTWNVWRHGSCLDCERDD